MLKRLLNGYESRSAADRKDRGDCGTRLAVKNGHQCPPNRSKLVTSQKTRTQAQIEQPPIPINDARGDKRSSMRARGGRSSKLSRCILSPCELSPHLTESMHDFLKKQHRFVSIV